MKFQKNERSLRCVRRERNKNILHTTPFVAFAIVFEYQSKEFLCLGSLPYLLFVCFLVDLRRARALTHNIICHTFLFTFYLWIFTKNGSFAKYGIYCVKHSIITTKLCSYCKQQHTPVCRCFFLLLFFFSSCRSIQDINWIKYHTSLVKNYQIWYIRFVFEYFSI